MVLSNFASTVYVHYFPIKAFMKTKKKGVMTSKDTVSTILASEYKTNSNQSIDKTTLKPTITIIITKPGVQGC